MSANPPKRFKLIDGLRGIAALMVVYFHLDLAIARTAPNWVPDSLRMLISHGSLGVDIFFVISGFVIAFSVRGGDYSLPFLGRFALRRSLRLDPPYWTIIALELVMIQVSLHYYPELGTPEPGRWQVLAHLFYLQNLLHFGDILPVFWTLCYEIQFYLFLVILLILRKRLGKGRSEAFVNTVSVAVFAALFALSVADRLDVAGMDVRGLFLDRWFQFSLGVMCWRYFDRGVGLRGLVVAWGSLTLFILSGIAPPTQFVAVGASILLVLAIRRVSLTTWLSMSWLQFLGKISYSLYLVHLTIGWRFVSLTQQLFPQFTSDPVSGFVVLHLGVAVSIVSAYLLWWLVERPSMGWSKRVALVRR